MEKHCIESEGPHPIAVLELEEVEEEEKENQKQMEIIIMILTCSPYKPQPNTKVHYSNVIFKSSCI
jgi:hypothetical protein